MRPLGTPGSRRWTLWLHVVFFLLIVPLTALLIAGSVVVGSLAIGNGCEGILATAVVCDVPPAGQAPGLTASSPAPGLTTSEVQALADRLRPSIVTVSHLLADNGLDRQEAVGTGVVLRSDGLILTANHVIRGGRPGSDITVTLSSGRRLDARVVGVDRSADVALLHVQEKDLPAASFAGEQETVARGDAVIAVGSRDVLSQPVIAGSVMKLQADVIIPEIPGMGALLETTVPLVPGTSGSPLIDARGRVVGLNIAGLIDPDTGESYGGLSVPATKVLAVSRRLLSRADAGTVTSARF